VVTVKQPPGVLGYNAPGSSSLPFPLLQLLTMVMISGVYVSRDSADFSNVTTLNVNNQTGLNVIYTYTAIPALENLAEGKISSR